MLRVGLTGGIGSGKSSVARLLVAHGAVLVDSDVLSREVVAPGTDGLAEVLAEFGPEVMGSGGELDRAALGALIFADATARARLGAIVHPRVRRRSAELVAAVPADAVVVQDVPLLVENGMAAEFPLVVVVHAPADERERRLVGRRGLTADDARARVAAQADDDARRAAADVWLTNDGPEDALVPAVAAVWTGRLAPFAENLRLDRVAPWPADAVAAPDPEWPAAAARLLARIVAAAGAHARGGAHVGPTAVPGMPAPDVIALQLGVADAAGLVAVGPALSAAGFPRLPGDGDRADAAGQRRHASADPGRPATLDVRVVGSLPWRDALLWRDWLRADPGARSGYRSGVAPPLGARNWATTTGWTPALN